MWCDVKKYVRLNNDQDFNKFNNLIETFLSLYEKKTYLGNIKLWSCFWKCLEMYVSNASYQGILQSLFEVKANLTKLHKKNSDFNTNFL